MNIDHVKQHWTIPQELAYLTFRKVATQIDTFVAEHGGWDKLPKQFTVTGPGWTAGEKAIEDAINKNDATATNITCISYESRVQSYLTGWQRKMLGEGERVPASAIKPEPEIPDDWD